MNEEARKQQQIKSGPTGEGLHNMKVVVFTLVGPKDERPRQKPDVKECNVDAADPEQVRDGKSLMNFLKVRRYIRPVARDIFPNLWKQRKEQLVYVGTMVGTLFAWELVESSLGTIPRVEDQIFIFVERPPASGSVKNSVSDALTVLREKRPDILKPKNTPPPQILSEWLSRTPCSVSMSMEEIKMFLDDAPVSRGTSSFILQYLQHIPRKGSYVHTIHPIDKVYFERRDYQMQLMALGQNQKMKAVILSGRRRTGKTKAIAHELIQVREAINEERDKVLFYCPGYADLDKVHVLTVIRLLSHMKIPAIFDEFTDHAKVEIGKAYKVLLEASGENELSSLSAVLFGSNVSSVRSKGLSSLIGLSALGGCMQWLPLPPINLILNMVQYNYENSKESELGLRFLQRFTLCGFDLGSHMNPEGGSLNSLKIGGVQGATYASGPHLQVLQRLCKKKGDSKGIDMFVLVDLEEHGFIKKRPTDDNYDFVDPRLLAYQCSFSNDSLEKVEGKVLEMLVREYLFLQLLTHLGMNDGSVLQVWYGNVTAKAEVDLLFFHGEVMVLVSIKRMQSSQKWKESFVDHLDNMCKEHKQLQNKKLLEPFCSSKKLRLVAVSAGIGEIQGMTPNRYNSGIVAGFQEKIIACESVLLHELLFQLESVNVFKVT